MSEEGRNRYCVELVVEFDVPLSTEAARPCGKLLAKDIAIALKPEWGWGRARIVGVYAPESQYANGDFVPDDEK